MMPKQESPLLVVPGGYGDGPAYRAAAVDRGQHVIGASSVSNDPARRVYGEWVQIPHVSDRGFAAAIGELVRKRGVGEIHASHHVVWFHLKDILPAISPDVILTRSRSNLQLEAEYLDLRNRVAAAPVIPELQAASTPGPALSPAESAGFLRAAFSIHGESYETKLFAMTEAARRTPPGDIVEVGCLFGRSAAYLGMLSHRYDLGSILCIDPWKKEETGQGVAILDAAGIISELQTRLAFEINVAPYAFGRLNYIQATSTAGAKQYGPGFTVETEMLGRTNYEGRISLLHIDGNHDYDHVKQDAEMWIPHVRPGGWIILDDYEWDWGDGPRRIGDAFLHDNAARIRTHFVAGHALFIQLQSTEGE
jgi:hypothetical protein